jgi:hypothetical protein
MEGLLAPLIDLEGGVAAPPVDDFRERLVDRYLNAVSPAAKAKGGRGGGRGGGGGGGGKKSSTGYRALSMGGSSCRLGLSDEWVDKATGVSVTRDELAELLNLKVLPPHCMCTHHQNQTSLREGRGLLPDS